MIFYWKNVMMFVMRIAITSVTAMPVTDFLYVLSISSFLNFPQIQIIIS